MNKPKIFIACDTKSVIKAKRIINQSKTNKIKIGYKFGLEFMNSKNGRKFISTLKNKTTYWSKITWHGKYNVISGYFKDLNVNYLTVHISSGLAALKAVKKASKSNTKIVGVTTLTSLNNKDLKLIDIINQ